MKTRTAVVALTAASLLAACSSGSASYQQRIDYLRKVAQRGADAHALIASQEANIDKARCERAFKGLNTTDAPHVYSNDSDPAAWSDQIKEFFVDSCISGKPKAVPSDQPGTPTSSMPVAPTVPDSAVPSAAGSSSR